MPENCSGEVIPIRISALQRVATGRRPRVLHRPILMVRGGHFYIFFHVRHRFVVVLSVDRFRQWIRSRRCRLIALMVTIWAVCVILQGHIGRIGLLTRRVKKRCDQEATGRALLGPGHGFCGGAGGRKCDAEISRGVGWIIRSFVLHAR